MFRAESERKISTANSSWRKGAGLKQWPFDHEMCRAFQSTGDAARARVAFTSSSFCA